MSGYLIDTHVLLWWHEDDPQLTETVKELMSNSNHSFFVSIVSFWEIVIKNSLNKLKMDYKIDELAAACIENKIQILPIHFFHLSQLSLLPLIHRDPFDRMIVATAYCDKMTLISKDKALAAYNIDVIW